MERIRLSIDSGGISWPCRAPAARVMLSFISVPLRLIACLSVERKASISSTNLACHSVAHGGSYAPISGQPSIGFPPLLGAPGSPQRYPTAGGFPLGHVQSFRVLGYSLPLAAGPPLTQVGTGAGSP